MLVISGSLIYFSEDEMAPSAWSDIRNELSIFRNLKVHPHVVSILGCCTTAVKMHLVKKTIYFAPGTNCIHLQSYKYHAAYLGLDMPQFVRHQIGSYLYHLIIAIYGFTLKGSIGQPLIQF